MKKNGFLKYLPVWAIVVAVLNVLTWVPPFEKTKLLYTIYGIAMTVLVLQLLIVFFAFRNKNKSVSYSVFKYSITGLIFIFLVNVYFVGDYYDYWRWFNHNKPLEPWMFIVINVVALALNYISLIILSTVMNKNVERDEEFNNKVDIMRSLTNEAKTLYDNSDNKDVYRLYEALRYSDKRTDENAAVYEEKIASAIAGLSEVLGKANEEEIKENVDQIIRIVNERNNNR